MSVPILPVSGLASLNALDPAAAASSSGPAGFARLLMDGISHVNQKVLDAEHLTTAFAVDGDSVPVHQVTFALQEARLSVEFMLQVRTRLIDAYQQFASMQL